MEGLELQSFKIISNAGDASSKFLMAIRFAEDAQFEQAWECIEDGKKSLTEAHQAQTTLIQSEANGEKMEVSLLLVHAQDHLMNAFVYCDLVKTVLRLYEKLEAK